MLFKTPRLKEEFGRLHPELQTLVHDLDEWLFESGMERLTVTDAIRTLDEQQAIYTPHYLAKRLEPGAAKRMARAKPSWHLYSCGIDFRHSVNPYKPEERARIWEWLKNRTTPDPYEKDALTWELLDHDVGLGKHFHLAVRDWVWRRKWEQENPRG